MAQKETNLPGLEDWSGYEADIDARYAFQKFYGKTNSQMMREYKENVLARIADLRFMPKIPLCYYILGFKDFVLSGDFNEFDGPDAVSGFVELVHWMSINRFSDIEPVLQDLMGGLDYLADNQEELGAREYIYGSFREMVLEIKAAALKHRRG